MRVTPLCSVKYSVGKRARASAVKVYNSGNFGSSSRDLVGPSDMAITSDTDTIVFVVDDDSDVCEGLKALLESVGIRCVTFQSTAEFLRSAKYDKGKLSHPGRSYARSRWA